MEYGGEAVLPSTLSCSHTSTQDVTNIPRICNTYLMISFLFPASYIYVSRLGLSAPALWGSPHFPHTPGACSAWVLLTPTQATSQACNSLPLPQGTPSPCLRALPPALGSQSTKCTRIPRSPQRSCLRAEPLCWDQPVGSGLIPMISPCLQFTHLCPPPEYNPMNAGLSPCCLLTCSSGVLQKWLLTPPLLVSMPSAM